MQQHLHFENTVILYASKNNPGARVLAAELEAAYPGIGATEEAPASLQGDVEAGASTSDTKVGLEATHFLLYLNFHTYLEEAGAQLAEELRKARAANLAIVMAHENDNDRSGCDFGRFFSTTPGDLIRDGLYKALAFACYPGEHRAASMALLALALGAVDKVSFSEVSFRSLSERLHKVRPAGWPKLKKMRTSRVQLERRMVVRAEIVPHSDV